MGKFLPPPNEIENIYPLTIVATRFNSLFVILNCDQHLKMVGQIQETEEPTHDLVEWMDSNNFTETKYGFGKTIQEAFEDYKYRLKL